MTQASLELSRKIYELVGEYETELRWTKTGYAGDDYRLRKPHNGICAPRHKFPAPNFAELIRILPKIGEKKDSFEAVAVCEECGEAQSSSKTCEHEPEWENMIARAHYIVNLYMSAHSEPEGMQEVEKYLLPLL